MTIGRYLTSVRRQILLQEEHPGDTFFYFVDFTEFHSPNPRATTYNGVRTFLALGADPSLATFYRQSDVPQVFELMWTLLNLSTGWSKGSDMSSDIVAQMKLYLMAADILGMRATICAGSASRKSEMFFTQRCADLLNRKRGQVVIPTPRNILSDAEDAALISAEHADIIDGPSVFCEPEDIKRWIDSLALLAKTLGPTHRLHTWFHAICKEAFARHEVDRLVSVSGPCLLLSNDARNDLIDEFVAHFTPIRERWFRDSYGDHDLEQLLITGAIRARQELVATSAVFRHALGF